MRAKKMRIASLVKVVYISPSSYGQSDQKGRMMAAAEMINVRRESMARRKIMTGVVATVLVLSLSGPLSASDDDRHDNNRRLRATLIGGAENPPVVSPGHGRFKAQRHGDRIRFELRYNQLETEDSDITQAHLHVENPGNNGPVAVFLCTNLGNTPPGATQRDCPLSPGRVRGEISAEDVQDAGDLIAGDLQGLLRLMGQGAVYVNLHTDAHPPGELRGQTNPRRR